MMVWLAFGIAAFAGLLVTESWARRAVRFGMRWSSRLVQCFLMALGFTIAVAMWFDWHDTTPVTVTPHDFWQLLLSTAGIVFCAVFFVAFPLWLALRHPCGERP